MRVYISFFLGLLGVSTICFLFSCSSGHSNNNPNNGGANGDYGFTPGAPTADLSGSSGHSFNLSHLDLYRGFSSTGNPNNNGNTQDQKNQDNQDNTNKDPFYKSPDVLANERSWGTSAAIAITNNNAFTDFRLGEIVNSMDDIEELRLYAQLNKVNKQAYYEGDITIAYWDHARENKPFRRIQFSSGRGANAKYNIWFKRNDNKNYFHGFFQERPRGGYPIAGSIIIVIDKPTPVVQNPDTPSTQVLYDGSIWSMQFRTTFNNQNSCNNHAQQYVHDYNKNAWGEKILTLEERGRQCWFITTGPFDCRTWRNGNGINPFKAIEPDDNCYAKIGTFQGLDILKAFGVNNFNELEVR